MASITSPADLLGDALDDAELADEPAPLTAGFAEHPATRPSANAQLPRTTKGRYFILLLRVGGSGRARWNRPACVDGQPE
ncbi:hypothetical protein EFN20_03415 [Propionibacterium freudenreichii]|nr:hypothetical protein [Propionibacterium freudenreichii]MCT3005687.1 hypothetical protein [Propionibacterium freudenreichii]MCT3008924.1 hypothetical protein [Propionibacterium freudenreichii]